MKKIFVNTVTIILVFSLLCSSAFAATYASNQLSSYETDAIHIGDGVISMMVSVTARQYMDTLGSSSIFVYHKVGSAWIIYDTFTQDDPGMTASDEIFHEDYITCEAYEGGQFKVEIVIFAKDYSGNSDSRVCTHYVNT